MFGRSEDEPPPQSRIGAVTAAVRPASAAADVGRGDALILLVFAIATIAASAWVLGGEERDAANDPKKEAERGEIRGLAGLSLAREQNLRRALEKVAASPQPLVMMIRVAPDRVNVGVRDADGTRKSLTIDPGFGISSNDAGVGDDDAVSARRIDAGAPERIMRAVTDRTKLPPDSLDYASLIVTRGLPGQWFLALKEGPARTRQWAAAADGTDVRKPGEPSRSQKRAQALAKRRADCFRNARTGPAVQRCIRKYR